MTTSIVVYHSEVVTTNEIGSYEFVGMKKETFLLNEFPTLVNVVHLVREWLGWMDECCEVWFEGRIDIGSSHGPQMKTMLPVCDEKEWTVYVSVMMKSEIHGIEMVTRMVVRNDVGDKSSQSPTLPEVVDEQHVECSIVLTQLSQETHVDTDPEEPPFVGSNEIVLNEEPVYGSVGVGDAAANMGFISGVDPQPIAIGFTLDVDPSFVKPKFMPQYEATFGDERVDDSADDRPVPELSKRNMALLQRALAEHASEMPDCWDLIQTHRVVADGLRFDDNMPPINHDNKRYHLDLLEYAVFYHRSFMVKHSWMRISATS
jgi:hypothetical protein